MGRLPDLDENRLSAEQRKAYDEIKRVRGQVRGPFAVWLRNAELGEGALKLQDLFASRVKLDRRLMQLMILVAARFANADALPIAVGAGVISDVTKCAAGIAGIPYASVATAASMDGYAASGAAMLEDGFKRTFACPPPIAWKPRAVSTPW